MGSKEVGELLKGGPPTAQQVATFHEKSDKNASPKALHHDLGPTANQASPGNHSHDGGASAKLTDIMSGITVIGSRGGNDALASLLTQLATEFGLVNNTTA